MCDELWSKWDEVMMAWYLIGSNEKARKSCQNSRSLEIRN
jgi:hypothetical protein